MKCVRCDLELPPGARHPGPDDCLEALKHENQVLRMRATAKCPKCLVPPLCLCDVKRVGRAKLREQSPQAAQIVDLLGHLLKPE